MNEEMFKGMLDYFNQTQENINANALAVRETTKNINIMVNGIMDIKTSVKEMSQNVENLSKDVKDTNGRVDTITIRLNELENNEEIKTSQKNKIITAAHKRVYELLGDDKMDHVKYFRIFVQRLYGAARRSAGLGSPLESTQKKDFERVLEYIQTWSPAVGCDQLKLEADGAAERRRIAKEQGYVS